MLHPNRFNIPNLREFYGSTEGNAHVMNIDNTVGAVGFVSRIAENVHPVRLIRIDEATGLPIRNEKGLCISCRPNQVGELVGVSRVPYGPPNNGALRELCVVLSLVQKRGYERSS